MCRECRSLIKFSFIDSFMLFKRLVGIMSRAIYFLFPPFMAREFLFPLRNPFPVGWVDCLHLPSPGWVHQ